MIPERPPRWAVEGLVIVTSILLAFWIDAWWDGVQEKRQEAALVASLGDELEANHRGVQRFLSGGAAHIDRIDRFLRSTGEQLRNTPHDSVHPLVEALWLPPTFDPLTSATSMFLDAPPRSASESLVLHRVVAAWGRALSDAQEEGLDLRAHASEVVDILTAYSVTLPPPPSDPISDWGEVDLLTGQNRTFVSTSIEQAGPDVLARLRADSAFVAALTRKMHDQRRYLFEIARASVNLEEILATPLMSTGR